MKEEIKQITTMKYLDLKTNTWKRRPWIEPKTTREHMILMQGYRVGLEIESSE